MKLIIEGKIHVSVEDSGMAKIAEVSTEAVDVFVRLHSYDLSDSPSHKQLDELISTGRVRVTIESI